MSKYTPGPWEFRSTWVQTEDKKKTPIANFNFYAASESNARLIAAAPELLEALQTMVKAFQTYAPKTDGSEYNCVIDARSAIAKAGGLE